MLRKFEKNVRKFENIFGKLCENSKNILEIFRTNFSKKSKKNFWYFFGISCTNLPYI